MLSVLIIHNPIENRKGLITHSYNLSVQKIQGFTSCCLCVNNPSSYRIPEGINYLLLQFFCAESSTFCLTRFIIFLFRKLNVSPILLSLSLRYRNLCEDKASASSSVFRYQFKNFLIKCDFKSHFVICV